MNFFKNEQLKVILSIILGILSGLVGITIFGMSGYMISLSYFNPPLITIILIIVIIKLCGMSKGIFKYFERLTSHEATFQMINRLRLSFLKESLSQNKETRDVRLTEKLNQYFDTIEDYYIRMIYPIVTAISVALIVIMLAALVDIKLVLILSLFSLLVLFIVPFIFKRKSQKLYDDDENIESTLYLNMYNLIYGFTDLFINEDIEKTKSQVKELINKSTEVKSSRLRMNALLRSIAQLLQIIGIALIIIFIDDVLLLPMIILIFINVAELLIPVMQPVSEVGRVKETIQLLESNELNNYGFNEKLSVNNLTFRYENSKRDVLKNITLNVNEGESHAIIGPSGSGKSTLLNHLITKDATVMPQFLDFYNGTLKENLTMFGKNEVSEDSLNEYLDYFQLKRFKLDDYIYATTQISAGERKRLHMIRMLLEQKNTFILDEPTAHLNEDLREKMWELLFQQHTLVVVTHDLTHLDKFDYIHYLKNGEIVESISSKELNNKSKEIYHILNDNLEI